MKLNIILENEIVSENLSHKERKRLADKFGTVNSVDDYWKTMNVVSTYLRKLIGKAKKASEENPNKSELIKLKIADVKDFLDNYLDEFVISLANPKVQDEINQDKIRRSDMSSKMADIANTVQSYKSDHEKEMVAAFGETPKQAVDRMRREKKDKLFESIAYLSSL